MLKKSTFSLLVALTAGCVLLSACNKYVARTDKKIETTMERVEELNQQENNLGDTVKNLKISFVGDSVMLGAVLSKTLQNTWKNGYFDAKQSRGMGAGISIIASQEWIWSILFI